MNTSNPTIEQILSLPTNCISLVDEQRLSDIFNFCDTRYQELKSQRVIRNKKLEDANKSALQVYEPKSFPWPNCSSVKYPLITNSSIDYASRIYPAVWQNGDVVKSRYYSQHKDYAAGERLSRFANYLLNEKIPAWPDSLDKLCAAYPVDGLVLKKIFPDPEEQVVRSDVVYPQDFFIGNDASSIDTAEFYFHRMLRSKRTMIQNLRSGLWSKLKEDEISDESGEFNQSSNAIARPEDKLVTTKSSVYEVIEGYINCDLDNDGMSEPYIVTFIPQFAKVVRIVPRYDVENIYRNSETNKIYKITAQEFFVPYEFLQSPDGSIYALGLGELLLPINDAINSGIDQLMDAGTLNNMNGGWVSKNVRLKQGEKPFEPGEWKAVDVYGGKLSESLVPTPKSEPSQTTFNLVTTLIDAGAKIGGAQQVSDIQIPSNLSQITSMALVENGMAGLKSVYERFHRSLSKEIRMILSWWFKNPDFKEYEMIAGEGSSADDFKLLDAIVPVSNPNLVTTISKATKAQQLLDLLETGVPDANKTIMQVAELLGINPADISKEQMSEMDKLALQYEGEKLNNLRADTVQRLAQAVRAKDNGIGDIMRANSETIARSGRALLDVNNAMRVKVAEKNGDSSFSREITDPRMLLQAIDALAAGVNIIFTTPAGKVIGEKLGQSIEDSTKGVKDTEPNETRVALAKTSVQGGLGLGDDVSAMK